MRRAHVWRFALGASLVAAAALAVRVGCAPVEFARPAAVAPGTPDLAAGAHGASTALDAAARAERTRGELAESPVTGASAADVGLLAGQGVLAFCVVDAATRAPVERFRVVHESGSPAVVEEVASPNLTHLGKGCARLAPRLQSGSASFTLWVQAPGYRAWTRKSVTLAHGQESDLGTIELERVPGATVRVVAAADGRMLAGAFVLLHAEALMPERAEDVQRLVESAQKLRGALATSESSCAFSDEHGVARLESPPGVTAALVVVHCQHAPRVEHGVFLPHGEDAERTVALEAGGTVLARVFTSRGDPIPGRQVERVDVGALGPHAVIADACLSGQRSPTDAAGTARFEHLAPGLHAFRIERVYHDGMFLLDPEEEDPTHPRSGFVTVRVLNGSTHEVELRAVDEGRLCVRVIAGGRPLANATIRIASGAGSDTLFVQAGQEPRAATDASGMACFAHLSLGQRYVSVAHDERSLPTEHEALIGPGENVLEIVLDEATIEGRVTDAQGLPLHAAVVQAELALKHGDFGGGGRMGSESLGGDVTIMTFTNEPEGRRVTTDAEGRYVLRGLPSKTSVRVTARLGGFVSRRTRTLELARNEHRTDVDFPLARAGSVRVLLRDSTGKPLAGWQVSIHVLNVVLDGAAADAIPSILGLPVAPRPEPLTTSFHEALWPYPTGKAGRVVIPDLAPGKWSLSADGPLPNGVAASKQVEVVVEPGVESTVELTIDG